MKRVATSLQGCFIIEPRVYGDTRGWFYELFNAERQPDPDRPFKVSQANVSRSARGVLRGLHYQWPRPQAKLVWVLEGEVFDVAVDLRQGSATYGHWEAAHLSADNQRQFLIPEGFAHGFQVLSENATFCYLCSDTYQADCDKSVHFADPRLAIEWPLASPVLSAKDANSRRLGEIDLAQLPHLP